MRRRLLMAALCWLILALPAWSGQSFTDVREQIYQQIAAHDDRRAAKLLIDAWQAEQPGGFPIAVDAMNRALGGHFGSAHALMAQAMVEQSDESRRLGDLVVTLLEDNREDCRFQLDRMLAIDPDNAYLRRRLTELPSKVKGHESGPTEIKPIQSQAIRDRLLQQLAAAQSRLGPVQDPELPVASPTPIPELPPSPSPSPSPAPRVVASPPEASPTPPPERPWWSWLPWAQTAAPPPSPAAPSPAPSPFAIAASPAPTASTPPPVILARPMPRPSAKLSPWALSLASPRPHPTARPTPHPTARPTPHPTARPTPHPTARPTPHPTARPTPHPTARPTPHPTARPRPHAMPTPRSPWRSRHASPTPGPRLTVTWRPTPVPVATPLPLSKRRVWIGESRIGLQARLGRPASSDDFSDHYDGLWIRYHGDKVTSYRTDSPFYLGPEGLQPGMGLGQALRRLPDADGLFHLKASGTATTSLYVISTSQGVVVECQKGSQGWIVQGLEVTSSLGVMQRFEDLHRLGTLRRLTSDYVFALMQQGLPLP